MRRALFVGAALAALWSFSGCAHSHGGRGRLGGHGLFGGLRGRAAAARGTEVVPTGPPTGAIAYPYYTTRGPRDFLADEPPSIGQ